MEEKRDKSNSLFFTGQWSRNMKLPFLAILHENVLWLAVERRRDFSHYY